ncbi:hypothetical protein JOM56_009771 [Amanita muscaria]
MADQSIQIGNHANLQRAAAIALLVGVNSLASYNSNNLTNITGSSIVAVNITPSGWYSDKPLPGSPNPFFEKLSLGPNTSPGIDHTQEAIHCFRIMNNQLQQDILDVGVNPAQFLTNAGVERLWPKKRDKRISRVLQYACTHWAKHLKEAKRNNNHLVEEVKKFVNKHLLHWTRS